MFDKLTQCEIQRIKSYGGAGKTLSPLCFNPVSYHYLVILTVSDRTETGIPIPYFLPCCLFFLYIIFWKALRFPFQYIDTTRFSFPGNNINDSFNILFKRCFIYTPFHYYIESHVKNFSFGNSINYDIYYSFRTLSKRSSFNTPSSYT